MRLLFVPDWVFAALKAQGVDRQSVLDSSIILGILSPDDVAFVQHIQDRLSEVLPESIIQTFQSNDDSYRRWPDSGSDNAVLTALFNVRVNGAPEPFVVPYDNLSVELMDENTLVFYPTISMKQYNENDGIGAKPNASMGAAKIDLLDCVIQKTYALMSFTDFALTPIMKDYLLSNQLQAMG